MADYIRGKMAYTKWDVDADNVDLDLHQDGQLPHVQTPSQDWFSGTKGKILKALFLIFIFLVGLIFGYLVRRGVHEIIYQKQTTKCPLSSDVYSFSEKNAQFLIDTISTKTMDQWLKRLSSEVHRAGTEYGRQLAEHIKGSWHKYGIDSVHLEKYYVLLSLLPSDAKNEVNVLDVNGLPLISASGEGEASANSKMRPYFAYSPNVTVQGNLAYVNYGRVDDFKQLGELNVSVKNCIVIMRSGKIDLTNKVKNAEKHQALGVIIYPDPYDVVSEAAGIYPNGTGLPPDGVIRGSLKMFPGDPLTPYLPSIENIFHSPINEMQLPSIPVQPICYEDAEKILRILGGPDSPGDWKGSLNASYSVGPEFLADSKASKVEVITRNQLHRRHIYNVIATIPGKFEPGRYVIIGCHHDSLTNGTSDPNSGLSILMEVARVLGQLRKTGWQPGRTIILASWDAEEFGAIGSYEWIQAHATEISHRTVAYINLDMAVTGNYTFEASGSPLLKQALIEATSMVHCHEEGHTRMTVYDMWRVRRPHKPNSSRPEAEILLPRGTSDFGNFFYSYGISSIHLQFVGRRHEPQGQLYHTAYDLYDVFTDYTDPGFEASLTLAQVLAVLTLKLSDTLNLPIRADHYSQHVEHDYFEFKKKYGWALKEVDVDLEPLDKAVDLFSDECIAYHDNFDGVGRHDLMLSLREYNDRLLEMERAFLLPSGFNTPNKNRHILFGPSPYNNHKGVIFPHLTLAILAVKQNNSDENVRHIKLHMSFAIHALHSATNVLKCDLHANPKSEL